ncbi:MAG: PEPxxWA-CTERM sorting domain-containing protein [Chakrabartia godavariana]
MKTFLRFSLAACALSLSVSAQASTVNIDLSGASTGTLITAPGGSFSQTFAGQTVAGAGITGSPTGPLSLAAAGTISVAFWNPVVSPAGNSLLSQPGNSAPLSILFDTLADSLTFTMGSSDAGSTIKVHAFGANGALLGSTQVTMLNGYNVYNLSGLGNFKGLTFFDNNDPAGVRFMNFAYNSVAGGGVPEPAAWAMMLAGFGIAGAAMRRRTRLQAA